MYSTQAVSRPEISAFLEQAQAAEAYFIGTRIFPVRPVKKRAGRYPRINLAKGNLLRREQTKRGSSGSYNETTQEHEWDTYDCEDRGLKQRIDDSKAEEMDEFFSIERQAAKNLRRKCLLDFEVNAANLLFDTNVFTAANAAVAYTEGNLATIDFPRDMNEAIERVTGRGEMVNTVVLSHQVWNRIRRSPKLQQYLYGTLGNHIQQRQIELKDLGEAFSLDTKEPVEFIVGRAKVDTSNRRKATSALTPIWANTHIWIGCVKGGDFDQGGVGRTLVWDADVPTGLYATETYRDEDRRSDMIRVRTNSIEKVVNENAGELITTNWS